MSDITAEDNWLNIDEIMKISTSAKVKEYTPKLTNFIKQSREQLSPIDLLKLQIEIANEIKICEKNISFFKEKADRKTQNSEWFTREVYKSLSRGLKQISDGIAWRYLSFNRSAIRKLSDHPITGFLADTFIKEIKEAEEIIRLTNRHVLLNDLTNCLRFGDLTVIGENEVSIAEVKSGNKDGGKNLKQKHKLDEVLEMLNKKKICILGETAEVIDIPGNTENFLGQVSIVINKALKSNTGTYSERFSPYLWVSVTSVDGYIEACKQSLEAIIFPESPFKKSIYFLPKGNLTTYDLFGPSKIPYTVYPFEDEIIAKIITGQIHIKCFIGETEILKSINSKGWKLNLPSKEIFDEFTNMNSIERRKVSSNPKYQPTLERGNFYTTIPWVVLYRIDLEFLSVKPLINMAEHIKETYQDTGLGGFTSDFKEEKSMWI